MDVNSSVAEIAESMRGEGERNGLVVETHYGPGPLVIEGDIFALGRVYRNLITNAIQATEPGGRVVIATARAGEWVEISVTDTGSGIPAERIARSSTTSSRPSAAASASAWRSPSGSSSS